MHTFVRTTHQHTLTINFPQLQPHKQRLHARCVPALFLFFFPPPFAATHRRSLSIVDEATRRKPLLPSPYLFLAATALAPLWHLLPYQRDHHQLWLLWLLQSKQRPRSPLPCTGMMLASSGLRWSTARPTASSPWICTSASPVRQWLPRIYAGHSAVSFLLLLITARVTSQAIVL